MECAQPGFESLLVRSVCELQRGTVSQHPAPSTTPCPWWGLNKCGRSYCHDSTSPLSSLPGSLLHAESPSPHCPGQGLSTDLHSQTCKVCRSHHRHRLTLEETEAQKRLSNVLRVTQPPHGGTEFAPGFSDADRPQRGNLHWTLNRGQAWEVGGKLPGSRGRKSPGARSLPASPDRGHSVSAWVGTPGSAPLCGRINLLFQKFPSLSTSGGSPTAERAPVLTPAQPESTWESLDAGSQSTATQGPTQPTVMLAMITKTIIK